MVLVDSKLDIFIENVEIGVIIDGATRVSSNVCMILEETYDDDKPSDDVYSIFKVTDSFLSVSVSVTALPSDGEAIVKTDSPCKVTVASVFRSMLT